MTPEQHIKSIEARMQRTSDEANTEATKVVAAMGMETSEAMMGMLLDGVKSPQHARAVLGSAPPKCAYYICLLASTALAQAIMQNINDKTFPDLKETGGA